MMQLPSRRRRRELKVIFSSFSVSSLGQKRQHTPRVHSSPAPTAWTSLMSRSAPTRWMSVTRPGASAWRSCRPVAVRVGDETWSRATCVNVSRRRRKIEGDRSSGLARPDGRPVSSMSRRWSGHRRPGRSRERNPLCW